MIVVGGPCKKAETALGSDQKDRSATSKIARLVLLLTRAKIWKCIQDKMKEIYKISTVTQKLNLIILSVKMSTKGKKSAPTFLYIFALRVNMHGC